MPKTRSESIENLATAREILNKLGIPFCLFLGTALGAYRDGDFCEDDEDDVDLAVHIDHISRIDQIQEAFTAAGFETKRYYHKDALSPEVCFKKEHDGWHTKVDIFFVRPKDGNIIWSFYTADGVQNREVKNYMLSFDTVEFFGQRYNVPQPIEAYLRDNYGDWKTPIPRRNWSWEKDNKCPIL